MKKQENIKQELNSIAPFLAQVKKPIQNMEVNDSMLRIQKLVLQNVSEETISIELKNIAPLLHNIEKPILSGAIDFSALQQRVLAKIESSEMETKKPVTRSIFSTLENVFSARIALPIAAIFTLAILTTTFISFEKQDMNLSQLSSEEIHAYLADNVDEVEEYLLINEKTNILFINEKIATQQIENYLNQEPTLELL